MKRKNIIVVLHPDKRVECFGNLRKVCIKYGLVYNTIVQKKMPIEKDGLLIQRVPFN